MSVEDLNWSCYFHAGDAWLMSLQVLEENKHQIFLGIFYVIPQIVSFCLELFIKSRVSYVDNTFNGLDYKHKTSKILLKYRNDIPIFEKIVSDEKVFKLIETYESTIDTKYGQTYVSLDGADQKKIIDIVYELRTEICGLTGLH